MSGVLKVLQNLPLFDRYVSNAAVQNKKTLLYDLWGRPTIEFYATCGKSINEAAQVLQKIEDFPDILNLVVAIWIVAFVFMSLALILYSLRMIFFCKNRCHYNCIYICGFGECNLVWPQVILFILNLVFFIIAVINFQQYNIRIPRLRDWLEYSPCVDTYMKINEYQMSKLE